MVSDPPPNTPSQYTITYDFFSLTYQLQNTIITDMNNTERPTNINLTVINTKIGKNTIKNDLVGSCVA